MNTEAALTIYKGSQSLSKPERDQIWAEAGALIRAGMFPQKFKTAEEAFMVALYGREIGLSTQRAWKQIHLIKGQPALEVHLQVAMVRQAIPGLIWKIKEHTDKICVIEHGRSRDDLNETTFTWAEAEAAGLTKPYRSGEPSNYVKDGKSMMYARCAGRAVRWFYPETQSGGLLHNVEEMRDALEDRGGATLADKVEEARNGKGRMPKKGDEPQAAEAKVVEAEIVDESAKPIENAQASEVPPPPTPAPNPDAVDEEAVLALVATITRCANLNDLDRAHTEWRALGKHNPATLIKGYDAKESRQRELTTPK